MKSRFIALGINYGGHDTSAAMMVDGELVAACEEERYTKMKHSREFPSKAIDDCLRLGGIGIEDIDEIAFGFDPIYHIQEAYLKAALLAPERINLLLQDVDRIGEKYKTEEMIRKKTGYRGQIAYYNHHSCHLASAYYPSGFSEAIVASYDGIGEIETGLLGVGRYGTIELFHSNSRFPDSFGLLYSAITYYLGWQHHCDEGIVMGLATYGDPHNTVFGTNKTYYQFFEEILVDKGNYDYEVCKDWISYHLTRDEWISNQFVSVFGASREHGEEISQHHMDIAAALQMRLEVIVLKQLKRARGHLGIKRLCLAGGVALNCSMNGKIESAGLFDELYIQPASGDAGVAVGACYLAEKKNRSTVLPRRNTNFYLGSGLESEQVKQVFDDKGLEPSQPENLYAWTAKQLSEGKIIGWFQGRSEFGPRALGNRSILTRPYPAEMKDYLNARVKFRESFRPFAPAIMSEYLFDYFDIGQESPHMLIACQAKEAARKSAPAVVHVDNSCRVQSVDRQTNERFYDLLKAFHANTGCPILLNTSFNVKGQPMVNTPTEAIDCFLSTNIDCLVIGDSVVDKKNVSKTLLEKYSGIDSPGRDASDYFGELSESYGDDYQDVRHIKYPANRYRLKIVEQLIRDLRPRRILDIGCGTGEPLIAINKMGFNIEGFDISDAMIRKAKSNLIDSGIGLTLIHKNDMEQPVGLEEASFDCLLALGAVYYSRNFERTMERMAALLSRDGDFIFSLRNDLFSLFSGNEYTAEFLLKEMIPESKLTKEGKRILTGILAEAYHSPIVQREFETVDTQNVFSIKHNPLTVVDEVLAPAGLILKNIYYYHFHALPPALEHLIPEEFRELSTSLEGNADWRSPFMASSFIVHAKKC